MHRIIGAMLALVVTASCGGGGGSDLSKALCADLDSGLTLQGIYGGASEHYTPEEFAGQVYVAVDDACPEYKDDPAVRNMLEGHGYLTPGEPWP